jgi:hypothetical protein
MIGLDTPLLAKAASADALDVNALVVLMGAGVAAAAAALAAVPVVMAARRRHRQRDGVTAAAVLWAVVTAGLVIWAVNRSWSASAERQRQIMSGDYDPRDLPAEPASPWPMYAALTAAYVGLVAWSAAGRGSAPPSPPPP